MRIELRQNLTKSAGTAPENDFSPYLDTFLLDGAKQPLGAVLVLPGGGEEMADAPAVALVSKVYAGDAGYAVEVTPGGFDNTITMMVGVDTQGKVLGISVIKHTETAGLGAVAAAKTSKGEAFRAQFVGLSGSVGTEKRGTGNLDAITGATITSEAVCTGVNAALACVANMG